MFRSPQIAELIEQRGPWQPSLFDERRLIALDSARYPGERLVVCRNPALAEGRVRKRAELLAATQVELAGVAQATARTCFYACWPTTSSGIYAKRSSPCFMTMRTWRRGVISARQSGDVDAAPRGSQRQSRAPPYRRCATRA
ncbi:hypothetical protein PQR33_16015 [Paraburkholderia sediminicola]|uniref:hypothetical protein n=1 Tax=Paraburkholderia sediminicola TaxID=458836 RepID=UPI0038B6DA14